MKANTTTDRMSVLEENLFAVASSILLFLIIFLASLNHLAFNTSFYTFEFQKLGVYNTFGRQTTDDQAKILLDYLDGKDELINSNFFNEKEKQHMIDVKNLIVLSKTILYASFMILSGIFIFFIKKKKNISRLISKTFIFTSMTSFTLLITAYLLQDQFSTIFYNFHLLFFNNQLWLLNPAVDNLINLFPQQFFYDIAAEIIKNILMFSTLFFLEGLLIKSTLSSLKHHRL